MAMASIAPEQFGKYQLLDKIAVGGMAELYRAKLTGVEGFEKLIAIKKILPHLSQEKDLVDAFIHEAKLAALLHHENIIQIYDFGCEQEAYFIAMEYLFGKDLRTVALQAEKKQQCLGLENVLYIVSRICAGLDYSHKLKDLQGRALNIIHRDINPQNIFITYDGQVKIIDFGIAKAASYNSTTHEGLVKGKLAYMSPEQANGEVVNHRVDIFASGVILYELLAGRRMFKGEALQVFSMVREANFEPPEEVIHDVPTELYEVLHRALAKNPEDRYQTCGDMLNDLEDVIFQLSFRPNERTLSDYLKGLFAEELAAEEIELWAKSQIYADDDDRKSQSLVRPDLERTVALNMRGGRFKRLNMRYLSLVAGILLLLGASGFFYASRMPSATVGAGGSVQPGPAPVASASDLTGKISAARSALEAGSFALARSLFEEVLHADPSLQSEIGHDYAKALEESATIAIKTDAAEAERLLLKALEVEPDDFESLSQLGFVYVQRKDYPKAIETYQRVAALKPQWPATYFNLGFIYAVTKDYKQAQAMYQRVVDLQPPFADEALYNLALVQVRLGHRQLSIQNLQRAVQLNPKNEPAMKLLQKLTETSENS
jgi:serine/threonine protein kinase